MEVILKALKCANCDQTLEKPVLLPCGDSICQKHTDKCDGVKCSLCDIVHDIRDRNLMPNKIAEKFLSTNIENFNFGENYSIAFNSYKHFRSELDTFEVLLNEPLAQIDSSINELRNEIEKKSESIKQRVDTYKQFLAKQIDEFGSACKKSIYSKEFETEAKRIVKDLDEQKDELDAIWTELCILDSSNIKWHLVTKRSEKNIQELYSKIKSYKSLILMNKFDDYFNLGREFDDVCFTKPGYGYKKFLKSSKMLDSTMTKNLLELCEFPLDSKWKLLYQASRDDFTASAFHSKCDYYPNTLTIVKSRNGNIFGAYANVEWNPNSSKTFDTEAFIFSLVNSHEKPIKIKNCDAENAVRCSADSGPLFGRGIDLALLNSGRNYSAFGFSYKHPDFRSGTSDANTFLAGAKYFIVLEIEIYQIFKP